MDFKEILSASEKIQSFIPKIKNFIPQLVASQIEFSKKHKLNENEFLIYSILLAPNGKIILYCFKCLQANEIKIGERIIKDTVILEEELFRVELTQYLDVIEKQGLIGLTNIIPMEQFMNFKF